MISPISGRTQTVVSFGASANPDFESVGGASLNGSVAHAIGLRDGRLHFFAHHAQGAERFDTGFACDSAHFGLSIVVGDGYDLLWVQNGRARVRAPGFFVVPSV
jgi:hypothetical protein